MNLYTFNTACELFLSTLKVLAQSNPFKIATPIRRQLIKAPMSACKFFLPLLNGQPLLSANNHFPEGDCLIGVGLYLRFKSTDISIDGFSLHGCIHSIQTMRWFNWRVTDNNNIAQFAYEVDYMSIYKQNDCYLPHESSHDLNWAATRM